MKYHRLAAGKGQIKESELEMKVVVTGAAGFIGSHLCEALLQRGHRIVGIDNFDPFYSEAIKRNNIHGLAISLIEGDLNESAVLEEIPYDTDLVIHLAAKAGVRPSLKNPPAYIDANIKATVSLMDTMVKKGIKRLLFASSSSVYGKSFQVPFKESDNLNDKISVYAASKHASEIFAKMYHNLYHMNVINMRFFTVYGERQRPDLAIYKFLKAALTDEEMTVFGDGSMGRDYTYIGDIVSGILAAAERIYNMNDICEVYNFGNSHPVSLNELIATIESVVGKKIRIKRGDIPPGDVPMTYADISLAKKRLNYNPQVSLREGLSRMGRWMQSTGLL